MTKTINEQPYKRWHNIDAGLTKQNMLLSFTYSPDGQILSVLRSNKVDIL